MRDTKGRFIKGHKKPQEMLDKISRSLKRIKIQKDITNKKFGRLVAIKFIERRKQHYYWLCKCDCGNEKIIAKIALFSGHTKSCGCLQKEYAKSGNSSRKHGMKSTLFYKVWSGILARCNNPNNPSSKYYGGRGIKCLWKSFEEFRDDMYESYLTHIKKFGRKQTQIDRIDVNGNYCKKNCRWVTIKEQQNNKRNKNYKLKK